MNTTSLLSLPELADALKLPQGWIRAEADAGRIPNLRIGKRYRFNREAVVAALLARASSVDGKEGDRE
ncbi:MAG TPA: helix-turn-helix domain-containing protein [Phycisphaerae bacterium]|nr:helix-turn-helix domain-containing protein [Phycisphaerae bacterium]